MGLEVEYGVVASKVEMNIKFIIKSIGNKRSWIYG
ncbi:Uncharacterised protein [Campylobacter geochelonis]|nr:Uncharacterised protein [Campylobacter geochelonis]CZE51127.1 Uncharacterised protein [Campylobacter geochelonis]